MQNLVARLFASEHILQYLLGASRDSIHLILSHDCWCWFARSFTRRLAQVTKSPMFFGLKKATMVQVIPSLSVQIEPVIFSNSALFFCRAMPFLWNLNCRKSVSFKFFLSLNVSAIGLGFSDLLIASRINLQMWSLSQPWEVQQSMWSLPGIYFVLNYLRMRLKIIPLMQLRWWLEKGGCRYTSSFLSGKSWKRFCHL